MDLNKIEELEKRIEELNVERDKLILEKHKLLNKEVYALEGKCFKENIDNNFRAFRIIKIEYISYKYYIRCELIDFSISFSKHDNYFTYLPYEQLDTFFGNQKDVLEMFDNCIEISTKEFEELRNNAFKTFSKYLGV